jgi:hypothetical protein
MRKWRSLVGGLVVLVAILGLTLLILARPNPTGRVTQANYNRLHEGLTRAEVEGLLGSGHELYSPDSPYAGRLLAWQGEELGILVVFDTSGRVSGATTLTGRPESVRQRVLRRLGFDPE